MAQQESMACLERVVTCPICGEHGDKLYSDLQDRQIRGHLGKWGFDKCPRCGHVWLTPRFTPEYISLAYDGYSDLRWSGDGPFSSSRWKLALKKAYFAAAYGYTAGTSLWQRLTGYVFYLCPPIKSKLDRQVMFLTNHKDGKLLDIGSGSGWFLENMQWLGWEVQGIDIDAVSAEKARKRRVDVRVGIVEEARYPDNTFDAITMTHVVEHLYEPRITLQECFRILRPGGRIVIITPNVESAEHRRFERCWQPLEPPRHLNLFTLKSIALAVEQTNFEIDKLYSVADGAAHFWRLSSAIESTGSYSSARSTPLRNKLTACAFYIAEWLGLLWDKSVGEEIILIGRK